MSGASVDARGGRDSKSALGRWGFTVRSSKLRWIVGAALGASVITSSGCGGALVRLAKQEQWSELDQRARAMKKPPRGRGARAWADALVALDKLEEARAVLLRDFEHGGHEASLLALAELEHQLGLNGMAAAHYARLLTLDIDEVQQSKQRGEVCELLRARAHAEAALAEPLAADTDMRRLALLCPTALTDEDRAFMTELRPQAETWAKAQRSLDGEIAAEPEAVDAAEHRLSEALGVARKRSPRAVAAVADAEGMQLTADDVAVMLASEFSGNLGPGLVSPRRLSAWIGNNEVDAVVEAIETLPDGVREYALLRLSGVRSSPRLADDRQAWIVSAMSALEGQGPHVAAKAWRVAASAGDLNGAELALNTNLRDMIPVAPEGQGEGEAGEGGEPKLERVGAGKHWSLRVPVDRRSFDLLLTLARLLEMRGKPVQALELRRSVIVAGYEVGLAQVTAVAADEVRRQLALGNFWQALAVAEVVPGPLVDEILPVVASGLGLERAASGPSAKEAAGEGDRKVVWRALGDGWFESWDPRLDNAIAGLDLEGRERCPELGRWLDPEFAGALASVGLDPERSRAALDAAFTKLDEPATGAALAEAIESDLALSCSAPLIALLDAGLHELTLERLDDRLVQAPELAAAGQKQLHAELALAHGAAGRAELLTIEAAALSPDPRALWARAAVAGASYGAREYTLTALREVIMHSDGMRNDAAARELALIRLRDVDDDPNLREGDEPALAELRQVVASYLAAAPAQRRWARLDDLLLTLAGEARADSQAWSLLRAAVIDEQARRRHPDAVLAFEAAAAEGGDAGGPAGVSVDPAAVAQLAFLSDADAVCELQGASWAAVDELALGQVAVVVGSASACGPKLRAEALALLLERGDPELRSDLLERVLAGPVAIEPEPGQPGALRVRPALAREQLALRVAFGLSLDEVWVVD